MQPLRDSLTLKSVDIRSVLGVAPSTLADILKKAEIGPHSKGRGSIKDIPGPDVRKVFKSRGYGYNDNAQVIAFSICKGGVGKSTLSYYVSQRFSAYGAKVLVIDADPQGNLTAAFDLESYDYDIDEETPILIDLLTGDATMEETIIQFTPTLHLIPSTPLNSTLEGRIRDNYKNPSIPVRNILRPILHEYDYIVIDCAPALNLTNTAVTCASDLVILPVCPDKFTSIGLYQTIEELNNIEKDFSISIGRKIVFTKFDAREHTSLKYLGDIADGHRDIMFSTMIRTAADVKNAITRKEYLFDYRKSNAKEDYDSLTREIMGLDKFFEKKSTLQ